ncbi:glycerol-3-phosphate cytidylyltransferase [Labedella gwakjiensis]|uniref:Cytidyltransferase n=1 Tax=Labedella gwakjiensis TaxID=390269 RepID=A0A2P8GSF8_9MICO|nr:adenylyltransferase/cytidyltransferase family protein [Labedella gwakjiensis]PSL36903.1 glycerol-3-phosphate cytidylyltransferase [Labedella gwakjiensis]RUQ84396.1 cytidyltransferase [Labedella gwakjiensis]
MIRIGYAAGAFDLFHVGHLNILKHAKSACDYLIAGVVSDELLISRKKVTPVIPLAERMEIVGNIRYVDQVVAEDLPSKMEMWERLRFTTFFKGDDWRGTPQGLALEQQFSEVGVEVVYFPYTMSTSSTALRRALASLEAGATVSEPAAARG